MSIKIPVSAELNQQDVTQQIQQIEAALNDLGRVAQDAGRIKFTPITKTSIDDARRMKQEFEAMVRMAPGLKRSLEAGGQGGKAFEDIKWDKVWTDDRQRAAHAETMVRRLKPGTAELVRPAPGGSGGGGSGGSGGAGGNGSGGGGAGGGGDRTPGTGGSGWRRAVTGGLAGVAGGVASQVGGMAGGVASGALAGGLAGGPIGAVVGGLAGSLTSLLGVIGDARDLAIGIDTLKRTLGDTNVSFADLQGKTRSLADEFSLSDSEASSLTKRYATISGSGKDLGALRDEVGVGVGFSRSFGLDPSAGVDFFGQMKGMGITQGADDNKKLALLIGESVAKAGDLPRLGDVLAGLTRYMEGAARTSLTSPNSAAWLSRFAGLEKSGLAGMDPTTAASIIGSIDGSIRQGGITEAGKNFMNGTLQKDQGLNTIQAAIQLEGGAFGTGRSTFGADSPMSRFYSRFGGGSPLSSWTSDESNVSVLQRNLIKQYQGKPPELMLDAFKNTFGTSYGQSAAWMATDPQQNDSMLKRMQRLGINWKDVNATGVSQLSQIESNSSLSEEQKDTMVKDAASKNQEDTVGSEARKASVDGANAMVRLAAEGLPMLSSIQAGVLKLAGIDPMGPQKAMLKEEHDKKVNEIDNGKLGADYGNAVKQYKDVTPLVKQLTGLGLTEEQQQAKDRMNEAGAKLTSARKAEDKRYDGAVSDLKTTPGTFGTSSKSPAASPATDQKTQKLLAENDAKHQAALSKIKSEQGKILAEASRDAFTIMTPEELNSPDAKLSDDQQQAKDRFQAAKTDYDTATGEENARWTGERKKLSDTPASTAATRSTADEHEVRLAKIEKEKGSELASARDSYQLVAPKDQSPLTDEQSFAKDRMDAAQADYDKTIAEEKARYSASSKSKSAGTANGVTPELLARAAESDKKAGLPDGTTAALMMQESSFNSGAVSSAGAKGLHQLMPGNINEFSRRVGRQLDPTNTDDSFYMYDELMKERKDKYGSNTEKKLRSYHGGYDEDQWGPVNADYVPAIERRKREMAAAGQTTQQMTHKVDVDVTMRDQNGNAINDAAINTTVGKPAVSGVNP